MMIESLAEEFAHELLELIGSKNMYEVNVRNHRSDYKGCCASHDFCDANMVMESAMIETYGYSIDVETNDADSEKIMGIMNEAWDTAKLHDFY